MPRNTKKYVIKWSGWSGGRYIVRELPEYGRLSRKRDAERHMRWAGNMGLLGSGNGHAFVGKESDIVVKRTVLEALSELDDAGGKVGQAEYYIVRERRGRDYLSGIPYLWTSYLERAFVFASRVQAQALIDEFPQELADAFVHERVVGDPRNS